MLMYLKVYVSHAIDPSRLYAKIIGRLNKFDLYLRKGLCTLYRVWHPRHLSTVLPEPAYADIESNFPPATERN